MATINPDVAFFMEEAFLLRNESKHFFDENVTSPFFNGLKNDNIIYINLNKLRLSILLGHTLKELWEFLRDTLNTLVDLKKYYGIHKQIKTSDYAYNNHYLTWSVVYQKFHLKDTV